MSMADKFAHLKHRDKLTTEDVAAQAGIPVGTLNKIFAGQTQNPSLRTMDRICRVFNVPIRYLLDEEILAEQSLSAYVESHGMFMLSQQEYNQFLQYRLLAEQERRGIAHMLSHYTATLGTPNPTPTTRTLPCYEPLGIGRQGIYTDVWPTRALVVQLNHITRQADFSIALITDCLSPIYCVGTILAVQKVACRNDQLGVFLLNGEGFIRKLKRFRGEIRLLPLKTGQPSICVSPQDTLQCLGVVLGAIREFQCL